MSLAAFKRDVGFGPGLAMPVALSLLLFAQLCGASTILTSSGTVTDPTYSGTLPVTSAYPLSDGSDGIFQPEVDVMLDLVPDAVFNFSTITISPFISVGFNRTSPDVPVYFLATGDVLIDGVLNGGSGPLYISTPGSITLNGDLLGQGLTLSGSQIVISSGATITGTNIALGSNQLDTIQPRDPVLFPETRLVLDWQQFIQVTPVPIPPSLVLLLTGLIPMWLAGRFRFRRIGQSEA